MVKLDQALPQVSPSCFCLSRFPAYEAGSGRVGGCGYDSFVDDRFGGYVGEVYGGGFVGIFGPVFAAEDGAGDGEDTFHVDWEGLMRLYGAGDLDKSGRFGGDDGKGGGGGGEALGVGAEGAFQCSKGARSVDESWWHGDA